MKRILYMASSINGFIANQDDTTSWISGKEWDSYSKMVQDTGCMIIGHRTYNILTTQPEFAEFKDVKIAAVSHEDFSVLSPNHSVAHSPTEALKVFKGQPAVVIAGGGILNSAFLAEDLVDELYLDIEPIAFGKGISLFGNANFTKQLKLLSVSRLSDDEVQLHYEVVR